MEDAPARARRRRQSANPGEIGWCGGEKVRFGDLVKEEGAPRGRFCLVSGAARGQQTVNKR